MAERKVVMVTGCSSGIGRATVEDLVRAGLHVIACVRTEQDAEMVRANRETVSTLLLDITVPEAIESARETIDERWPSGVDGLVNNAGIAVAGPLELLSIDQWQRQYDVNVFGMLRVTQAMLPALRKRSGRIINIGSAASNLALPMVGAYASSKFAVAGLSDALRRELAPLGVRVIVIHPGQTATPIFARSEQEIEANMEDLEDDRGYDAALRRLQELMHKSESSRRSPERVARAVRKALNARRPRARYNVGADAVGAAMVHCVVPTFLVDWVVNRQLYRQHR